MLIAVPNCLPEKIIILGIVDLENFSLKKYYFDAVAEDGDYFIGYFATLRFRGFSLCYSDTLHSPALQGIKPGPSFDCAASPVSDGRSLIWRPTDLGFTGTWQPLSPQFKTRLLSKVDGNVDWNCLQPSSQVTLSTDSAPNIKALGCCEHLSLTIPPWKIGLKTLSWGRFEHYFSNGE